MAQCKRCQSPIRWQKGEAGGRAWLALDQATGTPHVCSAPQTCRYCDKPIMWKEHEGKRQCFELDQTTLHNDVCPNRDSCPHCGLKVSWTLVDGKWLAMDAVLTRELHWGYCPKNPAGAKALLARLARLEAENVTLRAQVSEAQREKAYRDVELRRLTQRVEKVRGSG
jgi:hypothetical protein